jgi:hypothetical protein
MGRLDVDTVDSQVGWSDPFAEPTAGVIVERILSTVMIRYPGSAWTTEGLGFLIKSWAGAPPGNSPAPTTYKLPNMRNAYGDTYLITPNGATVVADSAGFETCFWGSLLFPCGGCDLDASTAFSGSGFFRVSQTDTFGAIGGYSVEGVPTALRKHRWIGAA